MGKIGTQAPVIGIDLGGTHIKGVLIQPETGALLHQLQTDTRDGNAAHWRQEILNMTAALKKAGTKVSGIGIAAPGIASPDHHRIVSMPGRLEGLEGLHWQELLQSEVYVLNDAQAALVAEVRYGSARGADHVLMLTLGTGVGGGLWLNGQLYEGNLNRAGHLGHMVLDCRHPEPDITNIPGSLEQSIGNATVALRTYGRYHDTTELVAAFRRKEPLATWAWLDAVRQLAIALSSMINMFSPQVVVLGGGLTQAGQALFGPLGTFMDIFEWRPVPDACKPVPIVKARFGPLSGAIGAAVSFNIHHPSGSTI